MAEKKQKGKKGIDLTKVAIFVVIAALIGVCGMSINNIADLHQERAELKAENEKLEAQKEDLEAELKNVNDLDYIEEQARKQLKMIKPGEVLFVLNEEGKPIIIDQNSGETYDVTESGGEG
ncbi:MAG: septum formation initiator family protein, partial [Clostridia bacterium]|nr:septum formation initiator family protein [Clostridia bacterium]